LRYLCPLLLYILSIEVCDNMFTFEQKNPIRKVYYVGTSAVLTIDPSHIRRLGIDEETFSEEVPAENGILLKMRRLVVPRKEEGEAE
jgi:hypothetical protein